MHRGPSVSAVFWCLLAFTGGCGHRVAVPAVSPGRSEKARLVAVEVFDTNPEMSVLVTARHDHAIRAALQDGGADGGAGLAAQIRAGGDFAYVKPSLVTYSETQTSYLTVDIVDRRDAEQRMPFRKPPEGLYPDPGQLLVAWGAYYDKVFDLVRRGQLWPPPADCPSFHCLGDPRQPDLAHFTAPFASVADHGDELALILRDDARAEHRATAAFLLAYLADGNTVVTDLLPAIHDSSALVRNNALRVLAEIALHHPEIDIPIDPVIEALSFPATSDRDKAAATLERLLTRPDGARLHRQVARDAGRVLLAMLALAQPNNHDFAYKILKQISGQSYGARDYEAWRGWLDGATSEH